MNNEDICSILSDQQEDLIDFISKYSYEKGKVTEICENQRELNGMEVDSVNVINAAPISDPQSHPLTENVNLPSTSNDPASNLELIDSQATGVSYIY